MLLSWDSFAPRGHRTNSLDSLVVTLGVGDAIGIVWVEAKGAAEHLTMHRTAPRRIIGPRSRMQLGKPCPGVGSTDTSHLAYQNLSFPSSPADLLLLLVPVPSRFPEPSLTPLPSVLHSKF